MSLNFALLRKLNFAAMDSATEILALVADMEPLFEKLGRISRLISYDGNWILFKHFHVINKLINPKPKIVLSFSVDEYLFDICFWLYKLKENISPR